ncbi:MAG: hypothetical protein HFI67_05255 [Lachnospiraceae bacterium]|nr:hypothetical protein [Lachnospiraceae bacterium]
MKSFKDKKGFVPTIKQMAEEFDIVNCEIRLAIEQLEKFGGIKITDIPRIYYVIIEYENKIVEKCNKLFTKGEYYMNTIAFICPISKKNTSERRRANDIMNRVLNPIATEIGYSVIRADFLEGENVIDDIIKMIIEADIVVADLTGFNPNVLYEFGIRKAIKGKCICIINKERRLDKLPFDISHFRATPYEFNSIESVDEFRKDIRNKIIYMAKLPYSPQVHLTASELSDLFGVTVIKKSICSKKDHYLLSNEVINRRCKQIFLMQRSSSIVLGAEQLWDEEKQFIKILMDAINNCDKFYHIISTEGIKAHIKRKSSFFPEFKDYNKRIFNHSGKAAVKCSDENKVFILKNLPEDDSDTYFKLDRQARIMSVEYEDGQVETIIVQSLGTDQTCFLIRGNYMKDYLTKCKNYYAECTPVTWRQIEDLYHQYEDIEKHK